MSNMKSALTAQIQKIGADLQSGVLPATTQNIIHLMDLKSKLDKAKALEGSQAAQQPQKPTVKDQIVGSAVQEARQASVEDMMRERARMMQDEMGQTGGISDFLPKPAEEAYAKGGPIAFAKRGLVPGETMAEQLQRLLDEQRAADYGWTEEAASAYEPKYYQTPEEARASMSRRSLAPTEQPMTLEELQRAQARARAQTGLGVRSGETIEVPPYREPVNIKAPQAAPPTGLRPYQYTGDILGSTQPIARPISGLLPDYSPVIEGRSFAHPTATPRADMEARLAERETFVGPRKGAAMYSPEAQAYLRDPSFIGKGTPIDEFVGPSATSTTAAPAPATSAINKGTLRTAGSLAGRTLGALSLPSMIDEMTGGLDPADIAHREKLRDIVKKKGVSGVIDYENAEFGRRSNEIGTSIQNAYREYVANPTKRLWYGEEGVLQSPDAYVGASERVAPKAPAAQPSTAPVIDKAASIKPQIGGADQRMQLRPAQVDRSAPVMGGNAPTADTRTTYAQPAQQAQPQQEERDQSLSDYMKQYREVTGENKGISALQNRLSEREARLAKEEDRIPGMALMQAGIAMMAGPSSNAMTNIAHGLMSGSQTYINSMNKLEDAKDKSFDIQAKLEEAQRAEELAAAKYGLESVQADKKAKQTARLEREKMANDVLIHDRTNAANLERERMQVGATKYAVDARNAAYGGTGKPTKLTDQQNYFNRVVEALEANPTWRPDLRHADGSPNPIAIEAERKKTSTDRRMEGFMGDSMGTSMGSGMMSTQPDPRYRLPSQQ